jgi:hypothetical protein
MGSGSDGAFLMDVVIAFFVPMIYVFLRVFQQRNVANEQYTWIIGTSYLITAFEIVNITLIVSRGWELYIPLSAGAAIGSTVAVYTHKRIVRNVRST